MTEILRKNDAAKTIEEIQANFPWDLLEKAYKAGLRTIGLPTKYGGPGPDTEPNMAMAAAVVLPVVVPTIMFRFQEVPWIVTFLATTFGFHYCFKSLILAQRTYPEGVDQNLHFFLMWYTSLPEPVFSNPPEDYDVRPPAI